MPVETTPQVAPGTLPLGSGARDLELVLTINAEQFTRLYPPLKFYVLDRSSTYVDPLYKESKTKAFHETRPVLVPVLVLIQPQEKLLRKYGIEEEQEALAVFCNRINTQLQIDPKTGDRLDYYAITYEILTVKHTDYFLNSQVPLNKVATLRQLNDSTAPTDGNRAWWLGQADP